MIESTDWFSASRDDVHSPGTAGRSAVVRGRIGNAGGRGGVGAHARYRLELADERVDPRDPARISRRSLCRGVRLQNPQNVIADGAERLLGRRNIALL